MSDTNRVKVAIVEESTLGVTPATPAFEEVRITGAPDLAFTPQTVTSEELRADRQISDLALVGAQAGGSIPIEISYGSFDKLLQAGLFSTWVEKANRKNESATEISAVSSTAYTVTDLAIDFAEGMLVRASGFTEAGNNRLFRAESGTGATSVVMTSGVVEASPPTTAVLKQVGFEGETADLETTVDGLASTLLDFTTLGLSVGEWIKIGGAATINQFATADVNAWVRVEGIAANLLTLSNKPTGWAADAGTGKEIMVFVGDYLRNGVLKRTFTVEETFQDHSPVTYQYLRGMGVGNIALTIPSQSIVTGNITFMGTSAEMTETRESGATDVAASTTGVMNSSSNVGRIAENGTPISGKNYVLEASIQINNNLRYQNAVGSIGAVGIGAGECNVSGSLNTYFDDKTIAEKVISNSETSFDMRVAKDSQIMLFDLPRMKYSGGAPTVPGKNQDVTLNAEFQAILSPTYGFTIQIQRFSEVQ